MYKILSPEQTESELCNYTVINYCTDEMVSNIYDNTQWPMFGTSKRVPQHIGNIYIYIYVGTYWKSLT